MGRHLDYWWRCDRSGRAGTCCVRGLGRGAVCWFRFRFLVRELGGLAVWDCVFLRNCPGIASVKGSVVTPVPGLVIIGVVLVRVTLGSRFYTGDGQSK